MSESNVPEIIKYLTEDNLKLMYSRLNRRYLVVDALPSVDSLEPADKNVIYVVKEIAGETVRYWPNVLDNDVWKPFGIDHADLDGKADKVDAVEGHLVVADKDGNLVDADILPGTFVALAFDPDEEIQPHATDIRKVWEAFQSGIPVMLLDNRTNGTGLYASLNAAGYTWPAGDEMAERLTDVDDNYRPYDNSVQGYYFDGKFYDDAAHTTQIEPSDGEVYHDIATDKTYIYGDETFTQVHRFIQFATNELIKDEPAWASRTSARPVFYRIFEPVGSATANNFDVVYGESTGIIKDDMTKKADKVSNAVQGHFAGLDASGNLTDSGAKASDFATAAQGRKADTALQEHQDISGKADKSAMDITYVEGDNTKKHIQLKNGLGTDVVTKHQDISGKAEKSEMTVTAGDGVAKVQLKAGLSVDVITDISGKQDVINDIEDIRSGAAAGATAYQKPGSGIPKSDLVSGVQASLDKADTALQSSDIKGKANKSEMFITEVSGDETKKTIQLKDGLSQDVVVDISTKVDKEEGKGLSTNDFTDEEKSKLDDAFNDCHTHENKDLLDGIESYVSGVEKSQDGKTLTIHQTTGETVSDVSFSGELNRIETVTQNGTPLDIVNKTVEITETVQTVSVNGIELPNDGHNIDIGVASPDGSVTVTSGEHGVELSATVYKGDSPINVNEDRISLDPSAITTIEETETIHVRQETNPAGNAVFKLDVDANAGKSYTGESPVQVDNVTNQIGIMKSPLRFEAPIKGTLSPTSLTIGLDYTKTKSMGRIYASVADAVADAANLSVGEYFETNGFHASGDGGAARYIVSDTGTANGMDIVQLTAGKLAVLQYFNSVSTFDSAVTESDYRLHATASANTRIADDGSATPENGYTLYRFNNLTSGSLIVVHTDDQCVFSTGASASTRIGSVLKSGPHIVVAGATWLLCSASQQFGIPKVILLNNSAGQQFAELSFGYYRDAPIYNTSVGSGLDDYGSVTTDASKTITRVNNLNEGDTVLIATDDKFIFSASASGSDRVGYPRRSGVYRVPSGVSWLLVCASSSLAPIVRVIDNSTELADYGLRIQQSSSPCTRLGKAGNLSFSLNSARTAVSDFDTHYPWNAIRECNISVDPDTGMRTVVYKGETGFSYNSNTFVEIPKFYFKRVVKNGYEDWYISNHPGDGFNLEPWFRDENGNELSVRYVGKYCISDGGLSTHGQPTTVQTKAYFKNVCEQDGFSLMNMHAYQALQHLCLIELGTKNSQEIFPGVSYYKYLGPTTNQIISSSGSTNTCRIATGDVANTYFAVGDQVAIFPTASEDWSTAELRTLTAFSVQETYIEFTFDGSPINLTEGVSRIFGVMQKNGRCDAINKTGMLASGNTHTRPFVYRGIENLYGNLGEFVDGITYDFTNKRLCIGSEYLTFETPINSNYIDSPNPGYIYSMGVDPNKPTVTMPKTLSVNPTSGYCDEWSTFGSGLAGDVVYGCAWDHMGGNGLFCFRALTAGTNNRLYTGRAML